MKQGKKLLSDELTNIVLAHTQKELFIRNKAKEYGSLDGQFSSQSIRSYIGACWRTHLYKARDLPQGSFGIGYLTKMELVLGTVDSHLAHAASMYLEEQKDI